jgi:hypothetical protein
MHLPLRRERVVECLSRRLGPGATTDDECRGECGGRRMDDLVPPVHRYLSSLATRNLTSLFAVVFALRATRSRSGQTGSTGRPLGSPLAPERAAPCPLQRSREHSHARMTSHGSRSATASATRGLVLMELVDGERRTSAPCRNDGCQPEAPAASCMPGHRKVPADGRSRRVSGCRAV